MTEDARETIVAPAAQRARDVGGHRGIWIAGALAVLSILVLAGLMLLRSSTQQAQIDALATSAVDNHDAAQQLANQVRQLGGVPTTQPPPVTGAQGPQGLQGPKGDKGDPGQPGKDGQTPPCLSTPAECQGAAGANGQNGTDGLSGTDGQPGKDGTNGAAGASGAAGPPGPAGQPPASWTWTSPLGVTYQCTRDAGSPDSAPTYSCAPPSTTTAAKTNGKG